MSHPHPSRSALDGGWHLTHTGYVERWNCDENDHLNVRFYWEHFAQGAALFAVLEGREPRPWTSRTVRYLRELRGGATTEVRTRRLDEHRLIHELHETDTGLLAATAVDTTGTSTHGEEEIWGARSLPAEPLSFDGEGDVTGRFVVRPDECDLAGAITDEALVGRFSTSAANMWRFAGIDRAFLDAHARGTVVVEKKITALGPALRAGEAVEIRGRATRSSAKTVRFDCGVHRVRDGTLVHAVALTALTMDLNTRRAVPLPDPLPALDERVVYKIVPRIDWEAARAVGRFVGAPVDRADGFIHFSTAAQAGETLAKHFAGQRDLLLVTVAVPRVARHMRWEVSRGGALFPHLYAPLPMEAVIAEAAIEDTPDGGNRLPEGIA